MISLSVDPLTARRTTRPVKSLLIRLVHAALAVGPLRPVLRPLVRLVSYGFEWTRFLRDLHRYRRMDGAEPVRFSDLRPVLFQRDMPIRVDAHYYNVHLWMMRRFAADTPSRHVDVASLYSFVSLLSCLAPVIYVEIRPPRHVPDGLSFVAGSLDNLPFAGESVSSLSCLHAAEHVGLGRYGDALDPHGTRTAARELSRVLAPGGMLYFAVPIGRPRLQFNGQRIHSAAQILDYFSGLRLREYSGVDDEGRFLENIPTDALDGCEHACGFFLFAKESRHHDIS